VNLVCQLISALPKQVFVWQMCNLFQVLTHSMPGKTANARNLKSTKVGFTPPVFEPIQLGPEGTWYCHAGSQIVAGARFERGVGTVLAWVTFAFFLGVTILSPLTSDYEMENMFFFVSFMSVVCAIPLFFAIRSMGKVEVRISKEELVLTQGISVFQSRHRFALRDIQKIRLIPRSTTFVSESGEGWSKAEIDFRKGSGVTLEVEIQTSGGNCSIAQDLNLDKVFYLRYVLVKSITAAKEAIGDANDASGLNLGQ